MITSQEDGYLVLHDTRQAAGYTRYTQAVRDMR